MRRWTKEEENYVVKNYKRWGAEKVGRKLNRTHNSVRIKAFRLGVECGYYYTEKEKQYIEKNLGEKSMKEIAEKLNRSYDAIKQVSSRMDLTVPGNADGLNVNEVSRLLGVPHATVCRWIKRHNIPTTRVGKFTMIMSDDLEDFLKNHQDRWNATKCETYYFEFYPWFHEKLLEDRKKRFDKNYEGTLFI